MRKMLTAVCIFAAMGCTPRKDAPPLSTALAGIAVHAGAMRGCAEIPLADRPQGLAIMADVELLAAGDPSAAYARLIALADEPALAYVWHELHAVLDAQYDLTANQWTDQAKAMLGSAIRGCRAGITAGRA